jgi:hypothetical protein
MAQKKQIHENTLVAIVILTIIHLPILMDILDYLEQWG